MPSSRAGKIQLRDIARRVGVSSSAVSLALRGDPRISAGTRKRIERTATELGYARPPRRPSGRTVARFGFVYCDPHPDRFDPVEFGPALRVMMGDALGMGARFELLQLDSDAPPAELRRRLLDFVGHLQGALLFGVVRAAPVQMLHDADVPTVVIGETDITFDQARTLRLQRVTDDPMNAGLIATSHLIHRGRRRIAFIAGLRQPGFYYDQWYRGYCLAHTMADITIEPRRVLFHDLARPLKERMTELTPARVRPDAVVYPDASIATACRPELAHLGIKIAAANEVLSAMAHSRSLKGQEHYPQVVTDLEALTREGIRRLQTIVQHPPETATTMVIPNVTRNME